MNKWSERENEIIKKAADLIGQGKVEEAIQLLDNGSKTFPKNAAMNEMLGEIHFEQPGKHNKELIFSLLERAAGLDPQNAPYQTELGRAYYWFGEWPKAEKTLKKAIELDPNNLNWTAPQKLDREMCQVW